MQKLYRSGAWILTRTSRASLSSFAGGVFALSWAHQGISRFGASKVSITGLLGVALLAYFIAQVLHRRFPVAGRNRAISDIGISLTLSLAAIFSPVLLQLGWQTSMALTTQWPTPFQQFYILVAGTAVSFLPIFTVAAWQFLRNTKPNSPSKRLLQLAFGAAFAIFLIAPRWGIHTSLLFAAICNIAVIIQNLVSMASSDGVDADSSEMNSAGITESTAPRIEFSTLIARLGIVFVSGFAFVCWQRFLDQLMLQGSWVTALEWIVVLAVFAVGMRFGKSAKSENMDLFTAAIGVLLLALFPVAISVSLDTSSFVSFVPLIGLIRSLIVVVVLAPLGLVLGVQFAAIRSTSDLARFVPPVFLTGVVASTWLIATQPLVVFLCGCSLSFLLFGAARLASNGNFLSRIAKLTIIVPLFVCAFIPLASQQYQPERSAKLLFDTGVFVANRYEKNSRVLEHLDEARCIASTETDSGTLSLWRLRGTQLQIRESGIPTSTVSTQRSICPSPSAESLRAIIPLALADRPNRIVMVRSGAGTTLNTSLLFPLEHIECIEPDQRAFEFIVDQVHGQAQRNPMTDDRVKVHHCDSQLALASMIDPCDVLMIDAGQLSVGSAASEITREFMLAAANCLTKDGVASMRFQYVDFGPGAVKVFVETWNSVFDKSGAIETAPGEWLLLGVNGERALLPDDFVQRLHKQHIRLALSELGWDWSTPLSLGFYTNDDFKDVFKNSPTVINTATNVRLTSWLPWEVIRWGSKYKEVMTRLGNHGQKLQRVVKDGDHKDVKHRMAELELQHNIIHDRPDSYWYYRNKVRSQLKEKPRSELVQVKGEKPKRKLHTEDRNRLKYFAQLGKVARLEKPNADSLLSMLDYGVPYDPLLTFFLHEEVAQFASRNRDEVADVELAFRLYRVNFTSPRDRSVRNITSAIEVLCDYPNTIASPVQRADHLDALLQILHQRWQNRGEVAPTSSPVVMNEIEMSIGAAEKAFKVLERSCEVRNMSAEAWSARKQAIEKSLVRPLRTYRTLLLRHSRS